MKKFILSLVLIFSLTSMQSAHAMDPKAKAFMIVSAYGTVGGALLGFATLAFGTNTRAIAQGASLGLYAGMIFGGYILATHGQQNVDAQMEPVYNDQPPVPGAFDQAGEGGFGSSDPYGQGGGFGAPQEENPNAGGFFGGGFRVQEIHDTYSQFKSTQGTSLNSPALVVPLYFGSF